MPTVAQINLENARFLAKSLATPKAKTGVAAFAVKVGMSESQVSQLIGANPAKNIGRMMARRFEKAFLLPEGWLDQERKATAIEPLVLPLEQRRLLEAFSGLTSRQKKEVLNQIESLRDENQSISSRLGQAPRGAASPTFVVENIPMTSLPQFLYHGTRAAHLESILANDLVPRSQSGKSQWQHTAESRLDAVYLTTAYPLHYAANAQADGDLLIVEIATARLDPSRLIADEDALAQADRRSNGSREALLERTVYFRERAHQYPAEQSLAVLGTCAHLGPVPKSALRRAVRIPVADIGMLILGGFDPVVSPLNYTLFGPDYEQSVRWLFGDTEVCALNPRMPRFSFEVINVEPAL